MKLWLVCFFLLFFAAEGLQWLGQFAWLNPVDLALPWAIAGGIGLAIASNHHRGSTPNLPPPPKSTNSVDPSAPPIPASPKPAAPQPTTKASSISFEIHKPRS